MTRAGTKRVRVERFDRETLTGFITTVAFSGPEGLELMSPAGVLSRLPAADVKYLVFISDREENTAALKKSFLSRPRLDGLWVRAEFRDGDTLEGVVPNDLLQMGEDGVQMIAPDGFQRVFVPRAAVRSLRVLGVVGSPLRAGRKARQKEAAPGQFGLFEPAEGGGQEPR